MDDMETGYYWGYELAADGSTLQTKGNPDVFFYSSEGDYILSIGYGVAISYNPKRHMLVQKLTFDKARNNDL